MGVAGIDNRRAAAAAEQARARAESHRRALGDRPRFDEEAAATAVDADRDLVGARSRQRRAGARAMWALLAANGCGLLIVAARVVEPAVDAVVPLAGALPLAALVGGGLAVGASARRARAVSRRRLAALQALGVSTVAAVLVRRDEVAAWEQRAVALGTAEEAADRAARAWAQVVGSPPGQPRPVRRARARPRRRRRRRLSLPSE